MKKLTREKLLSLLEEHDPHDLADLFGVHVVRIAAECRRLGIPFSGTRPPRKKTTRGGESATLYRLPKDLAPIPLPEGNQSTVSLTRTELYELVWSYSTLKLSRAWGITDVGLGKLCRRYQIPKPKPGEWAKLQAGYAIKRPRLPHCTRTDEIHIYAAGPRESKVEPIPLPEIRVPKSLHNPHPLVKETKECLDKLKPSDRGLLFSTGKPVLQMQIGPNSVGRILRLINTIIKEAERRGASVRIEQKTVPDYQAYRGPRYETVFTVKNERIRMFVEERTSWTAIPAHRIDKNSFHYKYSARPDQELTPNGTVYIHIAKEMYGFCRSWSDRKRVVLEDCVADIVHALEVVADEIKVRRQELEEEGVRREEARQRWEAEQKKIAQENRRRAALDKDVEAWTRANRIREYTTVQRARMQEPYPDGFSEWLKWAESVANELDPTCSTCPPDMKTFGGEK